MEELAKRLKELRLEAGLSMKQLSEKTGASDAAVCKWESGQNEPKAHYLIALSNIFNCSVDYLLGITDEFTLRKTSDDSAPVILTRKERELLNNFRELSPQLKNLVSDTLKYWKTLNKN